MVELPNNPVSKGKSGCLNVCSERFNMRKPNMPVIMKTTNEFIFLFSFSINNDEIAISMKGIIFSMKM